MKIPFFQPWITKNDKDAVMKALVQRWLTKSPILKKFEEKISEFVKSKYSIEDHHQTHTQFCQDL